MIQVSADERPAGGLGTGAPFPTMGQHGCCFDDDFMMYEFKIAKCLVSQPHLWRSCPFVHPGELVHRRHPGLYQGDLCPAVKQGRICPSGPERCVYAHSAFEAWLHPEKYKTIMCRKGSNCNRDICFFAHSTKEIRAPTKPRAMPPPDPSAEAVAAYSALVTGGTSQVPETPNVSLQVPSSASLAVPLSLPLAEPAGAVVSVTSMGPSVSLSGPSLQVPDQQLPGVAVAVAGPLGTVTLVQPALSGQQVLVQRGTQLLSAQQPQMLQQQMLPGQQQLQVPAQQVMMPNQQVLLQVPGQQVVLPGQQLLGQQQLPVPQQQMLVQVPGQQLQAPGQQVTVPAQQGVFLPLLPNGIAAVGHSINKPSSMTKSPSSSGSSSSNISGSGCGTSAAACWPATAVQQGPFLVPASAAAAAPSTAAAPGPSSVLCWRLQAALQGLPLPAAAAPAASSVAAAVVNVASASSAHTAHLAPTDLLVPLGAMQQQGLPSAVDGVAQAIPLQQQPATAAVIQPMGLVASGSPVAHSSASSCSAGVTDTSRVPLVNDLLGVSHMMSGLSIDPLAQPAASAAVVHHHHQQQQQQAQVLHHQLRHQQQQFNDSALNLCTANMAMHPSSSAAVQAVAPAAGSWVIKASPGETMFWQQVVPATGAVADRGLLQQHGYAVHPVGGVSHSQACRNDWFVSGLGI